jgi:hypothetical protein
MKYLISIGSIIPLPLQVLPTTNDGQRRWPWQPKARRLEGWSWWQWGFETSGTYWKQHVCTWCTTCPWGICWLLSVRCWCCAMAIGTHTEGVALTVQYEEGQSESVDNLICVYLMLSCHVQVLSDVNTCHVEPMSLLFSYIIWSPHINIMQEQTCTFHFLLWNITWINENNNLANLWYINFVCSYIWTCDNIWTCDVPCSKIWPNCNAWPHASLITPLVDTNKCNYIKWHVVKQNIIF